MIFIPSDSRGFADHGWLKSHHTFSFADYFNPERMGFGRLRVINDDVVEGGHGFGTHFHKEMEIISIPLSGQLRHKDSTGHEGLISKGEIQLMSAGTGIWHSEFNAQKTSPVNFLQIWMMPRELGIRPQYQQAHFDFAQDKFNVFIAPEQIENALIINQEAYFSFLKSSKKNTYKRFNHFNGVFLMVLKGKVKVGDFELSEKDAIGLSHQDITVLENEVISIESMVNTFESNAFNESNKSSQLSQTSELSQSSELNQTSELSQSSEILIIEVPM